MVSACNMRGLSCMRSLVKELETSSDRHAAPFQCACGTFLGGVFGNVLPHGRVVRRMGVLVSAWVWRWARV